MRERENFVDHSVVNESKKERDTQRTREAVRKRVRL